MKIFEVHKADSSGCEAHEGAILQADDRIKYDISTPLSQMATLFDADADKVVEFLTTTLPQGTLDRVIGKLLLKKSSHFVIPWVG